VNRTWVLLAGAVVTEVSASLSLKAALHHPLWYVVVVVGYVAAFGLLTLVLRRGLALGVAYGVWGACGVALTAVLGAVLYGEALTPTTGAGVALIIAGVLVVELDSRHDEPTGAR
jgi:small multidrug resistance pump